VDDQALVAAGFDLLHELDTAQLVGDATLAMFADPARRRGWLVGNTRALWPVFRAAREREPEVAAADHPLERYTEAAIARAAGPDARVWLGHVRYANGFAPLQRLAVAVGLGALAPSGLVIHPTFGPWFALRAVIAEPGEPPPRRLPIAKPCECGAPCREALAQAQAARGPEAWRAWLAVRDACSLRSHRYADEQVEYHYTRNRDRLA
jgi:hypothetical protein